MPRFDSVRRRAVALAAFAVGAAAGLLVAPSGALAADDVAAVRDFAAALETRVAALEDILATRISAENLTPPQDGGVVLMAPFTIVDSAGQVVFSIESDGRGGSLEVRGPGEQPALKLDGENARVEVSSDEGEIALGSDPAGSWGLAVSDAGGQPMADLSMPEGKGMALRIYNDGAPAAQIGTAPGAGGLLRLFANGDDLAVALDSQNDGTGTIKVRGEDDASGVTVDGKGQAVRAEGKTGIAVLGKDDAGWGVTLKQPGGGVEASLSNQSGRGMGLRIFEGSAEVVGLGNVPGKGGTVNVYSPSQDTAAASLFVNPDGSGSVQAGDGGEQGVKLDGENKRLLIASDEGSVNLGGGEDGWGLVIGEAGGAPMAELSQPEGKGMALRIYNKGANAAQLGTAPGAGGLLRLFSSGDRLTVGLDSNTDGSGKVHVTGKGSEDDGIVLDGQKEMVIVSSAKGAAEIGASPAGWGLTLGKPSGERVAELTQAAGKGMALRIFDGASQAAALGYLPGEGGQMRLYGQNALAVSLSAAGGGGVAQVYAGGRPTAGMLGQESTVAVYNSTGQAVSMLTLALSGSGGKVQATDPGGNPVFKAGYVPDGPGVACVSHKGTKCLGIGLTGMEGFR